MYTAYFCINSTKNEQTIFSIWKASIHIIQDFSAQLQLIFAHFIWYELFP
jgi:hypothetical protein